LLHARYRSEYGKFRFWSCHHHSAAGIDVDTAHRDRHDRAELRATGKNEPCDPRIVDTDGHIPSDWFRANV
jgi:hypothetical protein